MTFPLGKDETQHVYEKVVGLYVLMINACTGSSLYYQSNYQSRTVCFGPDFERREGSKKRVGFVSIIQRPDVSGSCV